MAMSETALVINKAPDQTQVAQMPENGTAAIMSMLDRLMSDPSISMDRANQAFDFYMKVQAQQARIAFEASMAAAKAEFSPVIKRHTVDYGEGVKRTTYKHEDLADIDAMADPILAQHGLNCRYRITSNPNEPVSVTCVISHSMGHYEETTLRAGADSSGGKNQNQAIGSTVTYLQRYTKKAALGLAAARDTDGKADDPVVTSDLISDEQVAELTALIHETKSDINKFLALGKVESLSDIAAKNFDKARDLLIEKKRRGK